MTEEQKEIFMSYIERLEKAASYEESRKIDQECRDWINSVFNTWKRRLKSNIRFYIEYFKDGNPSVVPYLSSILDSIDKWNDSFGFLQDYIGNICQYLYTLSSDYKLDEKGIFEYLFISVKFNYEEIISHLAKNYKKTIQTSEEWVKVNAYFEEYDENSTIREFIENIVFVLTYMPENIIDLDLNNPETLKTYLTSEMKNLQSMQYFSSYQSILERVVNLIEPETDENDCDFIFKMFSVVSDFCKSQAPDDFSSFVTDFIHWYNYDVGAIKFTTDDFIKILTEEESIDDENMTNLFYMEKQLEIVEYLNGRRDPEERYCQSDMVFSYFMFNSSFTSKRLQTMKTYLDSYMTREYTFDLTPSTYELDLLFYLSDKDLDTDTISSSIAAEFVHQADYNKQQLVDNDYYLKDDDTEYDKLIEAISTIDENTTIKEFLDNYDKAMDYLYQNSVFDENKSLERYKENAKGYLNEEFKTSDVKDVPEEYSYDFTDTEAFKAFVAKIDAIDSLEEFKKLANDQQLFITLMKDVSKEKKENAKKLWQLIFDNMSSEMTDEEKTSFEKALKEFKENPTDDLVDSIVEIYSNIILRFQSSSNQ